MRKHFLHSIHLPAFKTLWTLPIYLHWNVFKFYLIHLNRRSDFKNYLPILNFCFCQNNLFSLLIGPKLKLVAHGEMNLILDLLKYLCVRILLFDNSAILKYPGPGLIWKGGPGCLCRFFRRFLAKIFFNTFFLILNSFSIQFFFFEFFFFHI